MAVITEATVRSQLGKIKEKQYRHKKGDILTPSARQYLGDQGIKIIDETKPMAEEKLESETSKAPLENKASKEATVENPFKYVCYETGAHFMSKPEYMTQLMGNQLVVKNHKRIVLRGQIDKALANAVWLVQVFKKEGYAQVAKDLREICDWIRLIQRVEILEEPVPKLTFMGLDEATQKAMSHDPMKFFGTPHLFGIDENTNEIAVRLNIFRAEIRQLELSAVDAFYKPKDIERPDLLLTLNRLSSCVYLMMLKAVSGKYESESKK